MGDRALPEGFTLVERGTTAGSHKYVVEFPQAESLEAIQTAYEAEGKNYAEIMLAIWNKGNEQGAKQGQKEAVRKAVEDEGDVGEAVAKHQATAKGFIQGAPRGGGGARHESGLTAKQREAYGTAVVMEMQRTKGAVPKARMDEIAENLGIDPSQLDFQG